MVGMVDRLRLSGGWVGSGLLSMIFIGMCCMIFMKLLVVFLVGNVEKCELLLSWMLLMWLCRLRLGYVLIDMLMWLLMCICLSCDFLKFVVIYMCGVMIEKIDVFGCRNEFSCMLCCVI